MDNLRHTITKNVSSLMVAQIITWALALSLTIFLPRYLGVANIGKLQLANSIWGILSLLICFGTDILLTKEIARSPDKTGELIGISNIMRVILFFISYGLILVYIKFASYPQDTMRIIHIVGISTLIGTLGGNYLAALQGLEKMEYVSLSDILSKTVVTGITIVLLIMGYGIMMVVIVMIVGSLVSLLVQFFAVQRFQSLKFHFSGSKATWMLKAAFPYLLVGAFLTIYTQIDVIILSWLLSEESIGWYGAANRLFGTLLFVPLVIITAIFPVLSRMYSDGSNKLAQLFNKSFNILFLLSVPIGLGVFAIAQPVVILLYGDEFVNSGPILAILGIVLIFTYQNTLLGRFFISIDMQNKWTLVMAIATIATIPLDFILIPWCERQFGNGAMGGGISFLITEIGMCITGLFMLPRDILEKRNIWFAIRTLIAGIAMASIVWQLRNTFFLFPIGVGGITYVLVILVLRVIPKEDWALLQSITQNILSRFRKSRFGSQA